MLNCEMVLLENDKAQKLYNELEQRIKESKKKQ